MKTVTINSTIYNLSIVQTIKLNENACSIVFTYGVEYNNFKEVRFKTLAQARETFSKIQAILEN